MPAPSEKYTFISRVVSRVSAGVIAIAGVILSVWVQKGWGGGEGLISGTLLSVAFVGGPIFMIAGLMLWLGRSYLSKIAILTTAVAAILASLYFYDPVSDDGQAALVFVFVPPVLCLCVIVVGVLIGILEATFRSWGRLKEAKGMGVSVASKAMVKRFRKQFWIRLILLVLLLSLLSWAVVAYWEMIPQ